MAKKNKAGKREKWKRTTNHKSMALPQFKCGLDLERGPLSPVRTIR